MKTRNYFIILAVTGLLACKKDTKTSNPEPSTNTPAPTTETGSLKVEFEHLVDGEALVFGNQYKNQNGDTFTVSKFNYFISNIVLTKTDNSTYAEPESYHMVRHSSAGSNKLSLSVPVGNYKGISFMLGVDSARNTSGAQTGDLDPARVGDMFWSWSTGYIFFKLEGNSPQSTSSVKFISYHIGGYGGVNKTQRNYNFTFGSNPVIVNKPASPTINISVNLNEFFRTPNLISIAVLNNHSSAGATAKKFADNYADMFSLKSVVNN